MPLDLTPSIPPYYTIDETTPPTPGGNGSEYIATLTQATTANPTATIIKNDIGTITLTRIIAGQYDLVRTGAFTLATTIWYLTTNVAPETEGSIKMVWTDNNTLTIWTYNTMGVLADDVLVNTPVYIRKIT